MESGPPRPRPTPKARPTTIDPHERLRNAEDPVPWTLTPEELSAETVLDDGVDRKWIWGIPLRDGQARQSGGHVRKCEEMATPYDVMKSIVMNRKRPGDPAAGWPEYAVCTVEIVLVGPDVYRVSNPSQAYGQLWEITIGYNAYGQPRRGSIGYYIATVHDR